MIKSYWKPQGRSSVLMALAAALSLVAVASVEFFPSQHNAAGVDEKLRAAKNAAAAFETIKAERLQRAIEIDPVADPMQSGLIGELISPVTSNNGVLPAKQATVNPNFAPVVLDMLKKAGVEPGDTVAVGFSGSFPAMNICVLAALETLGAKPIIISSASGSQWGANHPDFLWPDMESALQRAGVFSSRSIAASLGGVDDRGIGMPNEGLERIRETISRNELSLIDSRNVIDGIDQRMELFRKHAEGADIKAYINVGGGTASVGGHTGKHQFDPGLNGHPPWGTQLEDSVMARFAEDGVPVIHLIQIHDLAVQYGLPTHFAAIPKVGEGDVYSARHYNTWLAAGGLLAILLTLSLPGYSNRWGRIQRNTIPDAPWPPAPDGNQQRNWQTAGQTIDRDEGQRNRRTLTPTNHEPIL